jgi:CHASE2 domain-containing sensor protein
MSGLSIVCAGVVAMTGALLADKRSPSRVWEYMFVISGMVLGAGLGAMWQDGWTVPVAFLLGSSCGALPFLLNLVPQRRMTSPEVHQFVQDLDDATYERLCWAMVDRSRSK